jgi:glycosyltransferase involved in cell wall biosynthesis
MRILFVTVGYPPEQTGGAESQARLQAQALKRSGNEVLILTTSKSIYWSYTRIDGITVIRLPRLRIRFLGTIFHLINLVISLGILRDEYEIIHIHLANSNADAAVLAGKILKKPTYIKLASGGATGEILRFRKLASLTRYFGLMNADRIQAISTEIYSEAISIGIKKARLVMIPNGVNLNKNVDLEVSKREFSKSLRKKLGISEQDFIFLYLGRIATYKGIDDLLSAWRLCSFEKNVFLALVGPTALDKPYVIEERGDNVLIVGNQFDTSEFILGANCFVLPSYSEGMSNALLEAMANKLPIISTDVGASGEVLNHGLGGRLVPPRSPSLLALSLRNSYDNPEDNLIMANYSFNQIAEKYNIQLVSTQILEEYRKIVQL